MRSPRRAGPFAAGCRGVDTGCVRCAEKALPAVPEDIAILVDTADKHAIHAPLLEPEDRGEQCGRSRHFELADREVRPGHPEEGREVGRRGVVHGRGEERRGGAGIAAVDERVEERERGARRAVAGRESDSHALVGAIDAGVAQGEAGPENRQSRDGVHPAQGTAVDEAVERRGVRTPDTRVAPAGFSGCRDTGRIAGEGATERFHTSPETADDADAPYRDPRAHRSALPRTRTALLPPKASESEIATLP